MDKIYKEQYPIEDCQTYKKREIQPTIENNQQKIWNLHSVTLILQRHLNNYACILCGQKGEKKEYIGNLET